MMLTESRNTRTLAIDQLNTLEMLELINREDASVPQVVSAILPEIAQAVDLITARLAKGGRLIYIGAGTSGRLGVLDAVECVPTFSTPPSLVQGLLAGGMSALTQSIEDAEDKPAAAVEDLQAIKLNAQDALVGIAASGRTPYVIGGLRYGREIGAGTIAVSCNAPAPILELAEIKIAALTGPEVITGSTRLKAGTAQKLILNMLSTASMVKLGKTYGNLMVDVKITNQKLGERARGIVMEVGEVSAEQAQSLLDQSGGEVKTALVMALLGLDAAEARARLGAAGGHLRAVLTGA